MCHESDAFDQFQCGGQVGDYRIQVQSIHRLAVIITIRHAEHRTACGTCGLGIVQRIADQQQSLDRHAEEFCTCSSGSGCGFFSGSVSPDSTMSK